MTEPATIKVYTPRGPLREFIDGIYFLGGDQIGTGVAFPRMNQTIIINVGSNFTVTGLYGASKERREETSPIWINGKQEIPFMLGNRGVTAMYAIILKLGMLPWFAGIPACETNEQTLGAEHWASNEIFDLQHRLLDCPTVEEGFVRIEHYFENLLGSRDLNGVEKVKWLGRAIERLSVDEICRTLGVTRKRLREEAIYYFGGSVKSIQGIIRLNNILSAIAHHPDQSLSSIHEYYDQSHFINDFRARTGITPMQYKRLCRHFPAIKHTPNFLPVTRETFLQFISA